MKPSYIITSPKKWSRKSIWLSGAGGRADGFTSLFYKTYALFYKTYRNTKVILEVNFA
jgi:hypothetical protein